MKSLDTDDFRAALDVWLAYHNGYGFPHAGGWAEQLAGVWVAIHVFARVYREHEDYVKMKEDQMSSAPGFKVA